MLLKDNVALITGAGRGIGRAIALCLAREGARSVLTGRNTDRLALVQREIRSGGGNAEAFLLDVTREDQAASVVERVIQEWGRIDVLVNNAGIIAYDTPVWDTTMEQWDQVMNTNLRGMHLVCRAVIPYMMRRQRGVIINVGSSSGRRPDGEYGAYTASKWGVVGYTASLAHSRSSLRDQRERHQSRLGGYRHGSDLQSGGRHGLDYSRRGGAGGLVPGGARTRHYDRAVHRPIRHMILHPVKWRSSDE